MNILLFRLFFYLLSLPFPLYVAYLATFCTYKTDGIYGKPTDERLMFPRIVYVFIWMVAFVPLLNHAAAIVYLILPWFDSDTFYIKSWLLEKPGQKKKEE